MTQAASTPRQVPPVVRMLLINFYLIPWVWFISFSHYRFLPFALVGQIYLVIVIILAFGLWPPMVRWMKAMPVLHRVIFGVLVGGMILGHLTLRSAAYFPFTAWGIFSQPTHNDPVTCPEFIATTKSGRAVRLLTEQLFPSIVQIWPMNSDKLTPAQTDHLGLTLARVYNIRHPDDPVQKLELVLMSVKITAPPGASQIQPSCQLLKRYDISSAH